MFELIDGRNNLWQWDTSRFIKVDDLETKIVHFANLEYGMAYVVECENEKARIPDELLQIPGELIAWAYIGDSNNGFTKIQHNYKIQKKAKPMDYVFLPTVQLSLQEINKKIGDLSKLTTTEKNDIVSAINEVAVLNQSDWNQSDWNQNDSTQTDYIRNRTHWKEENITELASGEGTTDFNNLNLFAILPDFDLKIGENYIVNYDGTDYRCECFASQVGGASLGNETLITRSVLQYPFFVTREYGGVFCASSEAGFHTIKIGLITRKYHTLDIGYLPIDEIVTTVLERVVDGNEVEY